MIAHVLAPLSRALAYSRLTDKARVAHRADRAGVLGPDAGIERTLDAAVAWLCHAQDRSRSGDGGVARHFSLTSGWGASYPETTGYIVPTLLRCAQLRKDELLRARVKRMLDWLVSIQLSCGAFSGGVIGEEPVVPVVFNTGQILLGLAAGVREFGATYREPMRRAASWLVDVQDSDGCWRRHGSPFAMAGEKTYDVHGAWGLLEAARLTAEPRFADAALANMRWALSRQHANGWFEDCCLGDPARPLTHTLGYALRGIVEAHTFSKEQAFLEAATRTADGLLSALRDDGSLPGRLERRWDAAVRWSCLTGTAQVAHCWLSLFTVTGRTAYRDAAFAANRFVRRTVVVDGPPEVRGGVKGSFPIYGDYGAYQYLNWACKFLIDALLCEQDVRRRRHGI